MNLGSLIGEQSLRIAQLEDIAKVRGVDPSAGVDVQDLQGKLRSAIEARNADADIHLQEKRRLAQINEGLRRQLQGHTLQVKLDAEIKGRAEDAIGFRKRILELEFDLKKARSAGSITPAPVPAAVATPQQISPPAARHQERIDRPYIPRAGTVNAEIMALLNRSAVELHYGKIVASLPQFSEGNVSVALGWLARRNHIVRIGAPKHYRYSKKIKAAA